MTTAASSLDTSEAFSELLCNASIEIAPREHTVINAVAEALPVNTCIYVSSTASCLLTETLVAIATIRRAGLDPVPHIAARRFTSKTELTEFLATVVGEYGVHRVLLIAGDVERPRGPYKDSLQLLDDGALHRAGIREVGISAYPEGHGRIDNADIDAAFSAKVALVRQQGMSVYVVTQFSFSTIRIASLCTELARREPELSVYVGVAGPTNPVALMRYAQHCGVSASLRAMGSLGAGLIGLATHTDPHEQLQAMAHYSEARKSSNVVGIHLYSFGGALRTAKWLSDRLRRT